MVAVPITGHRAASSSAHSPACSGWGRPRSAPSTATWSSCASGSPGRCTWSTVAGRLIYAPDPPQVGRPFSADRDRHREVLAGKVGASRTTAIDGHDAVAGYAPVPGTSWGLVAVEDWSSVMQSSQGYRRFLLALIIIGVVVPSLVVTFGVRRITRPIEALTDAAREVAGGNFDRTIAVSLPRRDRGACRAVQPHVGRAAGTRTRNSSSAWPTGRKELATLNAVAGRRQRFPRPRPHPRGRAGDHDAHDGHGIGRDLPSRRSRRAVAGRLPGLSPRMPEFVGGPLLEGWQWVGATDTSTAVLDVEGLLGGSVARRAARASIARGDPRPVGRERRRAGRHDPGQSAAC